MDAFVSYVNSYPVSFLHKTLTIGITLFLSSFILWSTIPTSYTSKDKSYLSSTNGVSKTCERSEIYFLNMETWNTSCIRSKSCGNSNRQVIDPILSRARMNRYTLDSTYLAFGIKWLIYKKLPWEIPCLLLQIPILFFECLHNFSTDLVLLWAYLG